MFGFGGSTTNENKTKDNKTKKNAYKNRSSDNVNNSNSGNSNNGNGTNDTNNPIHIETYTPNCNDNNHKKDKKTFESFLFGNQNQEYSSIADNEMNKVQVQNYDYGDKYQEVGISE